MSQRQIMYRIGMYWTALENKKRREVEDVKKIKELKKKEKEEKN